MNDYQTARENIINGVVEFSKCVGAGRWQIDELVGAATLLSVAMNELRRSLARARVLEWEGVWLWD